MFPSSHQNLILSTLLLARLGVRHRNRIAHRNTNAQIVENIKVKLNEFALDVLIPC
jgi:hypothetical protein